MAQYTHYTVARFLAVRFLQWKNTYPAQQRQVLFHSNVRETRKSQKHLLYPLLYIPWQRASQSGFSYNKTYCLHFCFSEVTANNEHTVVIK